MNLPLSWLDPPHEFSVMPFWFWNDDLDEGEIVRQIADFAAHGVLWLRHPSARWPATRWAGCRMRCSTTIQVAIEEAERRGMYVLLYDEGMYPSGSFERTGGGLES